MEENNMMNIIAVTCLVFMTLSFFGVVYVLYLLYKLEKAKTGKPFYKSFDEYAEKMLPSINDEIKIKESPETTIIKILSKKRCGNCASDCDKRTREINNSDGECLCYEDDMHIKKIKEIISGYAESQHIEEAKKVIGGYQPKQGFLMDNPPKKK